ncbi:929_t:CDS:2 [Paraglomus brasilianum]|uniref:929_t:CDS:1 n=1 Tax=Paraglomus brasilianum TaxID=144538 RepID=A0A9N9B5Y9_9GLOM|nr:929_t:CDS:2 [Paraglomus brasilianum]
MSQVNNKSGNAKILAVQQQIDSTKGQLQETIQALAAEGQKLRVLEEQTAMLHGSAEAFVSTSKKVKKKMWWKNTKMTIILTITIIAILAAIIIPAVLKAQGKI